MFFLPKGVFVRAASVLLLFANSLIGANAWETDNPPNILMIAVDDLNDWVGYTGAHPETITPNIDGLAARGTAFTNAYSQYPVCGPSRASMMLSLLPSTTGIYRQPRPDSVLVGTAKEHGTSLLHTYFADRGYKTMAVGKIFHRHVPEGTVDLSGGRGDWDRMPDNERINFDSNSTMTDWGAYPFPEEEMSDPQAASWAVSRLNEEHDKPFMLMVGFLRPHVPWHVPAEYFERIGEPDSITRPAFLENDFDDISAYAKEMNINGGYPRRRWAQESGQWGHLLQAYLASINFADHYVGEVLQALAGSQYADNTIVVLYSDHGYHMGEKDTHQKHTVWERANKVPLIFAGPGIPAGERRDQSVGLIDIYPTLTDLASLRPNSANEGNSLVPLIKDAKAEWPHAAISQVSKGDPVQRGQAAQLGDWRYIIYANGEEELYDHRTDPHEWHNLIAEESGRQRHEAIIQRLAAALPEEFFD